MTGDDPNSCYANLFLGQADQQHSFPVTARDTRAVLNCISEGLSCTGASSGDCSCDDKRDDDEDAMGFLNNYEMIIRDCDKLIEAFMVDERIWVGNGAEEAASVGDGTRSAR